jgi:hypothetical protein
LTDRDRALLRALQRLSRPRRRALVLHDALGLPAAAIAVEVEASTGAVERRVLAARAELARAVPQLVGTDPTAPGFPERLGGLLYRTAVRGCPQPPRRSSSRRARAVGRRHALALPAASGLLLVGTVAGLAGQLTGHGPAALFTDPAERPLPVCTDAGHGSAGPAGPHRSPGLRSPWCSTTPGRPAKLLAPTAQPLPPLPGGNAVPGGNAGRPPRPGTVPPGNLLPPNKTEPRTGGPVRGSVRDWLSPWRR